MSDRYHHTIMADEVCNHIPSHAKHILDGTVGHGGHTLAMYDYLCLHDRNDVHLSGVDKDADMLSSAQTRLSSHDSIRV